MALDLFYAPGSCAFAAMIALEHAGANYRPIRLDTAGGDQRSPEYLELNPLGRVPVLIVDDRPVTELIAVLTYIASRYPEARLLPLGDPLALARAYELLSWFSTSIHGYVAQILRGERFSDDAEVREALKLPGRRHLAEQMARLDQVCADRTTDGLIEDRFGVVDAFSLVIWRWAGKLEIDTTTMRAWATKSERDLALPAVARALEVEANTPRWSAMAVRGQGDGRL